MPDSIDRTRNRNAKGLRKTSKKVGAESSFEHYILGNAVGRIRPSKPNDKLWIVRRDEDAPEEYLPWLMLGMFPTRAGTGLIVGYHDGVRGIYSADGQQITAAGGNINLLNTGDTALQGWFSKTGYPGLVCTAIGTKTTPSTIVMIEAHEWVDEEGTLHTFRRAQQDLAAGIPAAGIQRLVLVGLLYDDTPFMVQGATRSSGITVQASHKQALLLAKPPRAIECAIYRLADGQTSVTEADKIWDAREILNTQRPPRHNWSATVNPAITDDSGEGYGIGSVWVNTTTPESFMLIDDAPGAAIWSSLTAVGSFTQYVKETVRLATAAALPALNYANGTAGVGATLTATANGALTVDGVAVTVADRILVKNQAAALQNGIYVVTAAGSGGAAFVLTRAADSDTSAELLNALVYARAGTVNANSGFFLTNTAAITIGTDAINYALGLHTPISLLNGGTGADLSATGGANQFVKQSSAGAVFTVGAITDADVPSVLTGSFLNSRVLTANMTIPDTHSLVVSDYYEVAAGVILTLEGDATLEIL